MDIGQLSSKILINADKFWHYVVISISNKEIKIANIILSILAIFVFSKYYKKILESILNKLAPNKQPDQQMVVARVASIIFGSILIILVLQISNIPLDAFAFLGGAFVLGFGLGVQNIINNLLSGLILIIEKPLKIGDFISVEGENGSRWHNL